MLLRVTHAFVTHTHMDHFAGFDHLLALGLGRMRRLVLWGGPGFVDQVEHKLRAYTWNVVHRYEVPMMIEAHALAPDGSRTPRALRQPSGFERFERRRRGPYGPPRPGERPAARRAAVRVRARVVDHEMPVLAFAHRGEGAGARRGRPHRRHGPGDRRLAAQLKHAVLAGAPDDTPIELAWHDRARRTRRAAQRRRAAPAGARHRAAGGASAT